MITKSSKIYIAGHKGMVGSAINRKLQSLNYTNIIFRSRKELDLLNKDDVNNFLKEEKKIVTYSSEQIQFISPFKKGEQLSVKKI